MTSLELAAILGKKHANIPRAIRKFSTTLDSEEFRKHFYSDFYKDPTGRDLPMYKLGSIALNLFINTLDAQSQLEYLKSGKSPEDYLRKVYEDSPTEEIKSVYVITTATRSTCKVGISEDPSERLKALSTGSSESLFIVWESYPTSSARLLEKMAHEHFSSRKLPGKREWFSVKPEEAVAYLSKVAA